MRFDSNAKVEDVSSEVLNAEEADEDVPCGRSPGRTVALGKDGREIRLRQLGVTCRGGVRREFGVSILSFGQAQDDGQRRLRRMARTVDASLCDFAV